MKIRKNKKKKENKTLKSWHLGMVLILLTKSSIPMNEKRQLGTYRGCWLVGSLWVRP
jgi:hypothetical protein